MLKLPANIWLGLFFFAFFFVWGIFVPFWALWLEGQGLSPDQIGLLLGLGLMLRFAGSLTIMPQINSASKLIPVVRWLGVLSLLAFSGFLFVSGFAWLAILTLLGNYLFAPFIPLGDAIATKWVYQIKMDYGKVRLWGSVSFIIASSSIGILISNFGTEVILYSILVGQAVLCLLLMLRPSPEPQDLPGGSTQKAGLWLVLKSPGVVKFIVMTALIQGSHAAYYGFSAIYWKSEGISETTIGYLWALGVVAETVLMAFSVRLFKHWSVAKMFMLGAFGGLVRWSLLASSSELSLIIFAQCLHALTFAATHMAAIKYISEEAVPGHGIQLQALYSAISLGLSTAMLTFICGYLYGDLNNGIYWLMAALMLPVFILCLNFRQEKAGNC